MFFLIIRCPMNKPFTITQEVSVTSVVNHWMCINQIWLYWYVFSARFIISCCLLQLFCSWVSSTVLPRTAQRSEFCSMVQNDPFSWKNEWSEANNGLYSFSLNYRPAWRDTRTQIDWVAVDKGLSLWRFITNF